MSASSCLGCCSVAVEVPDEQSASKTDDGQKQGFFASKTPEELAHLRLQVISTCGFVGCETSRTRTCWDDSRAALTSAGTVSCAAACPVARHLPFGAG